MEISDIWLMEIREKKYIALESISSFEICAIIFSYNAILPNNGENQQTIIN